MTETVESGATLAWRVLATLEGGTLVLAASALLAHVARTRGTRDTRARGPISVLISKTSTALGRELADQLRSHGCRVTAATSDATSDAKDSATSDAIDTATSDATDAATSVKKEEDGSAVDALIVVGAEPKVDGMEGLSELVSEDVYSNLKLLESLSPRVKPDGYMVWAACSGGATSGAMSGTMSGAASGAFSDATAAFDEVLRARLDDIANASRCTSVWVGRHKGVERTAAEVVSALLAPSDPADGSAYPASVRNIAAKVRSYCERILKIIS